MPGSVWLDTARIVEQLDRVIELLEAIAKQSPYYTPVTPTMDNPDPED